MLTNSQKKANKKIRRGNFNLLFYLALDCLDYIISKAHAK